ncbi:MAG: proline--tRNA ligase [Elusimicrobia bacterium]|nr:proline--tRNA ligase [Elusimicrobiota bacterium]MBU2615251.1 proline--tRNA ligase [Elusimicrobiota bacterium]
MKLSKLFLPTLREVPSEADTISSKLMLRSGMIRKLSSGIYEWLPIGLRTLKKVEQIVREEMNAIGGQEVWLPLLMPKELWEETGRWNIYGKELFRLKDRKDSEFCLGPTHEEVITDIVRKEIRSYKQLPAMFYQFGVKFRDEIRPRFGVMRAREFYMKDAYSFHADETDAEKYYQEAFEAYNKICRRCGFKFRAVEATSGAIGGSFSHEFMVLAETGEEEIAWCECGYAANLEKAECAKSDDAAQSSVPFSLEEVHTPNMKTIDDVASFFKTSPQNFIKSIIYLADKKPVMVLIRGDYEINENKVKEHIGCSELFLADPATVEKVTGAQVGFSGPVNLPISNSAAEKFQIVADYSVECMVNSVVGANKKDFHFKNVNLKRDFQPERFYDLRKAAKGDSCPRCKKLKIDFSRGIEVGHTFKLGTKYSKSMKANFLDAQGKEQLFIMGCYGIGVSRIVAACIEQMNDENGIIWPANIAPFQVILVPIDYKEAATKEATDKIYKQLADEGYEVLLDDRDERAGVKFKDADLIGIPVRITIGARNLPDKIEFKLRTGKTSELIPLNEIMAKIKSSSFY